MVLGPRFAEQMSHCWLDLYKSLTESSQYYCCLSMPSVLLTSRRPPECPPWSTACIFFNLLRGRTFLVVFVLLSAKLKRCSGTPFLTAMNMHQAFTFCRLDYGRRCPSILESVQIPPPGRSDPSHRSAAPSLEQHGSNFPLSIGGSDS
jgi:hypothetical protein